MCFSVGALRKVIQVSLCPITESRHQLWSLDAEENLLMIAAWESSLGKYLRQIGGGPACGIWQVEPNTMLDNYESFLNYSTRIPLSTQISEICGCSGPDLNHLIYNPIYNCIHARLKLYRSKGPLPSRNDTDGMARYAVKNYNGGGAATLSNYKNAYLRLVKGK